MKFKKIFQKAAAVVMAAVTVFSVLPATTAFAAVGDVGTISFSHTYDGNGNAMRYNSSANINGYIAGGTGNYKYRMFVDGDTAFCLQPGVPLKTGNTLKEASSEAWNALSRSQKKAVGLALLYGYQGNRGNLSGSDDEKWLATQTLVWEFVTGCREATGSYRQTSSTVYSLHFGSHYPNSGAKKVYDQIVSLMSKHNTIPSFMSGGKDDITKELVYKDGKYSLTLTDKNGVLSEYSFASSSDAVSVAKSGNKLTLTSKKAFHGYCYCYVKEWLNQHMEKAEQGIRFIDTQYKELFRIPDGGKIMVTTAWGEKREYTCRFIDEYHTEVGNNLYHIGEFAEFLHKNGAACDPISKEPQATKAPKHKDYER